MNRYILIRRLRGPAFLLLVGIMALLAQAHILSWGHSWPLYLILLGALLLAERAALSMAGYDGQTPYPGSQCGDSPYGNPSYGSGPYPGGANPQQAGQAPADPGTAIEPSRTEGFGNGGNGGQP
jgi:hypothetical protein